MLGLSEEGGLLVLGGDFGGLAVRAKMMAVVVGGE